MRKGQILTLLGIGLVAGGVATAVAVVPTWLPVQASREAGRIDFTIWFTIVISIVIFAIVAAVMIYEIAKFRAAPGDDSDGPPVHGHTGLEIGWTIVPLVIVTSIAIVSAIVLSRNGNAGVNPLQVDVTAQQYSWSFTYPDAHGLTSAVLRLPKDQLGDADDQLEGPPISSRVSRSAQATGVASNASILPPGKEIWPGWLGMSCERCVSRTVRGSRNTMGTSTAAGRGGAITARSSLNSGFRSQSLGPNARPVRGSKMAGDGAGSSPSCARARKPASVKASVLLSRGMSMARHISTAGVALANGCPRHPLQASHGEALSEAATPNRSPELVEGRPANFHLAAVRQPHRWDARWIFRVAGDVSEAPTQYTPRPALMPRGAVGASVWSPVKKPPRSLVKPITE